jgi:hypothetical protein
MKISISNSSLVGEIKRQFSLGYPFLKLEFLIPQRQSVKGGHQVIASDNTSLGHIQPAMSEGAMIVEDTTTVGELESFFKNHLLDVQVFRRSENLWLETTMTDAWTLKKQNSHGKEISEFKYISKSGRGYDNNIANDAI